MRLCVATGSVKLAKTNRECDLRKLWNGLLQVLWQPHLCGRWLPPGMLSLNSVRSETITVQFIVVLDVYLK